MRKTIKYPENLFRRALVFIVSICMTISFMPDEILKAYASLSDDNEVAEEVSDELKYRIISTSLGDGKDEVITLNGMMPADAEVSVENSGDYSDKGENKKSCNK